MKTGIYISGLGQSFVNESVEKYAERLMNEISFSGKGKEYELKVETLFYASQRETTVVSICEKKEGKVIYKLYDFKYHHILTEKFNSYSLLQKNIRLFMLVLQKFPMLIKRFFVRSSYNRPGQTLYIFMIFLLIACAILFMLPAMLGIVIDFFNNNEGSNILLDWKRSFGIDDIPYISLNALGNISKIMISVTALLLLIVPNANVLVASLATEFVCANDYMQHGIQKQVLQGNIELLVEYISEQEEDCKIHFHSYSFGTVLAIDYIYPFGNHLTQNARDFCEAIITIATPFEFIKSYYPEFYKKRVPELGDKLCWINVYSIADALATNFRCDTLVGDAEFGIDSACGIPINVNYEVTPFNKSIINFLMLYSIKVHGMYWDPKTEGQSCLRNIYEEMIKKNLI